MPLVWVDYNSGGPRMPLRTLSLRENALTGPIPQWTPHPTVGLRTLQVRLPLRAAADLGHGYVLHCRWTAVQKHVKVMTRF